MKYYSSLTRRKRGRKGVHVSRESAHHAHLSANHVCMPVNHACLSTMSVYLPTHASCFVFCVRVIPSIASFARATKPCRSGGGHLKPALGYGSLSCPRDPSLRVIDHAAESKSMSVATKAAAAAAAAEAAAGVAVSPWPHHAPGPGGEGPSCFSTLDQICFLRFLGGLWSPYTAFY